MARLLKYSCLDNKTVEFLKVGGTVYIKITKGSRVMTSIIGISLSDLQEAVAELSKTESNG